MARRSPALLLIFFKNIYAIKKESTKFLQIPRVFWFLHITSEQNTFMYLLASYLVFCYRRTNLLAVKSLSSWKYSSRCCTPPNVDLSTGWLWKCHRKWFISRLWSFSKQEVWNWVISYKFFQFKKEITMQFPTVTGINIWKFKKMATFCKIEKFVSICLEF